MFQFNKKKQKSYGKYYQKNKRDERLNKSMFITMNYGYNKTRP